MKNILVVFTGGTICSGAEDGIISPDENSIDRILGFGKFDGVSFESIKPVFILSENLSGEYLNSIISAVRDEISAVPSDKSPDGVIVLHGTDTLQYTASALNIAFGSADIPIAVTGADKPSDDEESNASSNFALSVKTVTQDKKKGVYICYNGKVMSPFSVFHHLEMSDEIYTDGFDYGTVPAPEFVFPEKSSVLVVKPYPGCGYYYDLEHVKSVLFEPYHSGTLPTSNGDFVDFCFKLKDKKIKMYVCDQAEGDIYESQTSFSLLGIKPIALHAIPAYMLLWAGAKL